MSVSPEQLTRVYIKIRDARAAATKAYKEAEAALKAQQDQVGNALLEYCKAEGINSSTTDSGQFIRSVKTKYWTSDWDEMNKFIMEHGLPEFYTKSLNQANVRQYLAENPDVIPKGLNVDSEYVITVRKPTKSKGA